MQTMPQPFYRIKYDGHYTFRKCLQHTKNLKMHGYFSCSYFSSLMLILTTISIKNDLYVAAYIAYICTPTGKVHIAYIYLGPFAYSPTQQYCVNYKLYGATRTCADVWSNTDI